MNLHPYQPLTLNFGLRPRNKPDLNVPNAAEKGIEPLLQSCAVAQRHALRYQQPLRERASDLFNPGGSAAKPLKLLLAFFDNRVRKAVNSVESRLQALQELVDCLS